MVMVDENCNRGGEGRIQLCVMFVLQLLRETCSQTWKENRDRVCCEIGFSFLNATNSTIVFTVYT